VFYEQGDVMDQARIAAATKGAKTYRGNACKNPDHRGGDGKSERYVTNGCCVSCSREKALAYSRRMRNVLRALAVED